MNAFIAPSDDQPVIVQNVLRCSRSSLAARLPSAFAAWRPARYVWMKKMGRNRHDRTRRRVIDTNGMRRGYPSSIHDLRERLVDQSGKPGADVAAIRQELDHQRHHQPALRVDTIHAAVRAAPPERADRIEAVRTIAIRRFKSKSEAESGGCMERPDLVRRHQVHGARRQDSDTVN